MSEYRETPGYRPEQNYASVNVYGQDIDDLIQQQIESEKKAKILEDSQRSTITEFSRFTLANSFGGWGGWTGHIAGMGIGGTVGFLAVYGLEQATGSRMLNFYIDLLPADWVASGAEVIQPYSDKLINILPETLGEKASQAKEYVGGLIMGFSSGTVLGNFISRKVSSSWWNKGDRLGASIGSKLAHPFMRMRSKHNPPYDVDQFRF